MKKLFCVLLALTLFLSACGKMPTTEPSTEAPTEAPTGAPTEAPTDPPAEKPAEDPTESTEIRKDGPFTYVYDGQGNLLEERYTENGVEMWKKVFTYDKNGNVRSETVYRDGVAEYSYEYNNEGAHTAYNSYENGRIFCRGVYLDGYYCYDYVEFYDENGQLRVFDDMFEDRPVLGRNFFVYDDGGNLVSVYDLHEGMAYDARYDDQGRVTWISDGTLDDTDTESYTYHEDGSYSVHGTGATWGSWDSEYDAQGRLISKVFYGDENVEYQDSYTYDEAGNLTEMLRTEYFYYEDDGEYSVDLRYAYDYDSQGNCVKMTICREGQDSIVHTYRYSWDENGNCTEKVCAKDGEEYVRQSWVYDEAGNVIEETEDYGDYSDVTLYTYDEAGRIATKYTDVDQGGGIHFIAYVYDDAGRLIEEIYC